MFDWLKRGSKAQAAQPQIEAKEQSVVSTQDLLDHAAQRQSQIDALSAQYSVILDQGLGSHARAQRAWGWEPSRSLPPWYRGESDAARRDRAQHDAALAKSRYEEERRRQSRDALVKQLYPLHLPDGWGFKPDGTHACFLFCPQAVRYHLYIDFVKNTEAVIAFDRVDGQHPRVHEKFKDKTELMLFLLTYKTEIKNESN